MSNIPGVRLEVPSNNELINLLTEWLSIQKQMVSPGIGIARAKLVRQTCDALGLDENDFLPKFVIQDKKNWGLS